MADFEHLDYYELLGVARSASADEIKRAYRREISKYHPDRFVGATPAEQEYAQLRSQRLTEAYSVLSDFNARSAYNRGQPPPAGKSRPPRPSEPPQHRDHQAELYEQAQAHIEAGRLLQAIGALRQLQQINPFYRDSADMLAAAEAELNRRSDRQGRRLPRPVLAIGALVGGVALVALAAWALNSRDATAGRNAGSATSQAAAVMTELPTRAPEPTTGREQPTAGVPPTSAPTELATVAPTEAPTAEPPTAAPPTEPPPPEPPTAFPTATPVVEEPGQLLLQDDFSGGGWADMNGGVWRVGYSNGRYRVRGEANTGAIWSYRTAPARDASIGVDVQVPEGEGGLLVRFLNENNYVSVTLNPAQTSFRVEEQSGASINVLAGGQSEVIAAGADATNRLVVRVRGDRMQVLVNGQQVADIAAPGMPNSTRYGLLVIAKGGASEAYFDNLEIRGLEG